MLRMITVVRERTTIKGFIAKKGFMVFRGKYPYKMDDRMVVNHGEDTLWVSSGWTCNGFIHLYGYDTRRGWRKGSMPLEDIEKYEEVFSYRDSLLEKWEYEEACKKASAYSQEELFGSTEEIYFPHGGEYAGEGVILRPTDRVGVFQKVVIDLEDSDEDEEGERLYVVVTNNDVESLKQKEEVFLYEEEEDSY